MTGHEHIGRIPRRFAGRLIRRARRMLQRGPHAAILMYHRVAEETFDPWGLAVSPANFREQVEWLARNRTILPLGELARLQRTGDLPERATAVTFDDGYAHTTETVRPLLQQFGMPTTMFIPADLMDRNREFWWDELEQIVLTSDKQAIMVNGNSVTLGQRSDEDRYWVAHTPPKTSRQAAFHSLWSQLKTKNSTGLLSAMGELRAQTPTRTRETHRPMSAEEVRATRSSLFQFGSHALTHPSLPRLSSKEKQYEIATSMKRCASVTGTAPTVFAYPYGDLDDECELLVRSAGFKSACTTASRFVARDDSPFALPRLQVSNANAESLKRMLLHG